jgi:hypothetical protein
MKKRSACCSSGLEGEVDRSIEHQAMFALVHAGQTAPLVEALRHSHKPALQRRALVMLDQLPKSPLSVTDVLPLIGSRDAALAPHGCERRGKTSGMDACREQLFLRRAEARYSFGRCAFVAGNRREAVARGNVSR